MGVSAAHLSGTPIGLAAATAATSPATSPAALNAIISQQRFLELSRFSGLRSYDVAQHMLTHQSAMSKLLGKKSNNSDFSTLSEQNLPAMLGKLTLCHQSFQGIHFNFEAFFLRKLT